jgi:transcriptional regulator with XRE-family HTH domain
MRITEASGGLPSRHISESLRAGPAVPRMVLGERLRRLREAQYISRKEAGEAIRVSDVTIAQLELGRSGFRERDVVDLLTIYGVTDQTERATLLALAAQANTRGWWHAYGDVLPDWLHTYLGLEQAADVIRSYEAQFVPGLLQTRDYARAVIALGRFDPTRRPPNDRLERQLELRMRRQRILHTSEGPHLWTVIDEAALRRPIGGRDVQRAQLRHLITMSELPHVTVQVMPFEVGGHAAAGGSFTLLRLPEREVPDAVFIEQLLGATYPDEGEDIETYRHVMDRVVVEAAPTGQTPEILQRIAGEL